MKALAPALVSLAALAACATATNAPAAAPTPASARAALDAYYQSVPAERLPVAPAGKALPAADAVLTRILVGSCEDEEIASPALAAIAREKADLFLMIGDNVYGDMDNNKPTPLDLELSELVQSFADLARLPEFVALRQAHPILAIWDDHDYGLNDGGREFISKRFAERIHETFWGASAGDAATREGAYYARSFGPAGQRVQVIMLDTRYFRGPLTRTDEYGKKGKERYVPTPSGQPQDMLGEAQWAWLQAELAKPADLRLLVSSIQVTPDVHGWEAWSTMPDERAKLYAMLKSTGALEDTVLVSGDRHTAFLYANTAAGAARPVPEITTSSINKSFAKTEIPDENDPQQVGDGYAFTNYGAIDIDWAGRAVKLSILDETGKLVRQTDATF